MHNADIPPVALIADAHYHCMDSNYGVSFMLGDKPVALRSWADTRKSSRVFNESDDALHHALMDIQRRGIRHIALLGDYTDDGQIEATARLVDLLQHYQEQFGLAFYALPGNHDVYGPVGKHQSTRFVTSAENTVLVTSDPEVAASEPQTSILTPAMYCQGYSKGLQTMAQFGYFKQPDYFHWESPFGQNDSEASRQYEARSADGKGVRQLMDASYLVEPAHGLWLLMIDANVFEPRNGEWQLAQKKAFIDSSDAGWQSVLRNKPHLIEWIRDVCRRAQSLDKQLIACSHYPVLDVFQDPKNTEQRLFGHNDTVKRRPSRIVGQTLASAGLRMHFSGHLHVNGRTAQNIGSHELIDIAVPSTASFPPCYKVVDCSSGHIEVDTIALYDMPVNRQLTGYYQEELTCTQQATDPALTAKTYGEFLHRRTATRVMHHLLPKVWPATIARQIHTTTAADLAVFMLAHRASLDITPDKPLPAQPVFQALSSTTNAAAQHSRLRLMLHTHQLTVAQLEACSMMSLVVDWYCLRQAGDQSSQFIGYDKFLLYHFLAHTFGSTAVSDDATTQGFFALFLGTMQQYLSAANVNVSEP